MINDVVISIRKKLSSFLYTFKQFFACSQEIPHKRLVYFKVILVALSSSVFLTIFLQTPFFADRGLNNIALILWPALLLLVIFFDFRAFINSFLKSFLFISPFIIYLCLAFIFGVNAFAGDLTKLIFFSFALLIIGQTISSYISYKNMQLIMLGFIISSFLFAFILFVTVLIHSDLSSPTYAYDGKNEAAPIFLISTIFVYFVSNKKTFWATITRLLIAIFFIVIIFLMKCRTMIIIMPIVYFIIFMRSKPSAWLFVTVVIAMLAGIIIVFAVPQIRSIIIDDIFYNTKQSQGIDDISSGRFTLVYYALLKLKPVFGNGNTYVDCLPVQILCSYGVIGTILLIPFCFYPSYVIHKYKKAHGSSDSYCILLLLLIIFIVNSILEGHGHFGPGAKTFIFWILYGCLDYNYSENKVDVLTTSISNKSKTNHFVTVISSISFVILLILSFVPSVYNSLSLSIYKRLDRENVTGKYVPAESVEIVGPTTMYVGQTIKYSSIVYPENSTDSKVYWESWGTSFIKADKETGYITALQPHNGISLNAYCRNKNTESQIVIKIVSEDNYDYSKDNFNISILDQTEECELLIGQYAAIKYDKGMFGGAHSLIFTSSDSDILDIDSNNNIITKKSGECYVTGKITNSKSILYSNTIKVIVRNEHIPVIDRIDLDLPNAIYQNIEYDLNPVFYSGNNIIECNNFEVTSSNSSFVYDGGKIRFKNFTDNTSFTLKPLYSNNDASLNKSTVVLKNAPASLSINVPGWICVNDYFEVKVIINYENGMTRNAQINELTYKSDWANSRSSGACNDILHFVSVTNDTGLVVYDLNGTAIYKNKKFKIYKLPKNEYYQLSKKAISAIVPLVSLFIAMLVSLLCIKNKKRYSAFIKPGLMVLSFIPIVPLILINGVVPFYPFYVAIGLSVGCLVLFNIFLARKKYDGLFESGVIFEKNEKIIHENKYYEIQI